MSSNSRSKPEVNHPNHHLTLPHVQPRFNFWTVCLNTVRPRQEAVVCSGGACGTVRQNPPCCAWKYNNDGTVRGMARRLAGHVEMCRDPGERGMWEVSLQPARSSVLRSLRRSPTNIPAVITNTIITNAMSCHRRPSSVLLLLRPVPSFPSACHCSSSCHCFSLFSFSFLISSPLIYSYCF
ncbi:hypothetical protein O3P69_008247 [Scylla paramamosain]|uniref:Uncharacterized protein n=1 Tax=Scylla paramamosain TaxID=85552 RepID=A0AAW0T0S8_SCYPA